MSLPSIPDSFKSKSFWERPEGTTGLLTLSLLGLAGFFLGKTILAPIVALLGLAITAVGETIFLVLMCAVLAALLYVLTNKKFLTLCSYMFKSFMRKLTGLVVEIDPIGIMRNYIQDATANLSKIDEGVGKLSSQVAICQRKVTANEAGYQNAMKTATLAQQKGMKSAFTLNARQAGRLHQSNETLQSLLSTMQLHLRAMMKYREVSQTVIDDLKNEVGVREDERKMILTSYGVMQVAKKILRGDPDKKELFDLAMDYVVSDYGNKLGEIQNFIEDSRGFVEGLDLQNGVFEADALQKIKDWEAKADGLLIAGPTEHPINAQFTEVKAPQEAGVDYTKFLR